MPEGDAADSPLRNPSASNRYDTAPDVSRPYLRVVFPSADVPKCSRKRLQVPGILHPQEPRGAPETRQDGDVPGGVLLHAASGSGGAPKAQHPVPQSLSEVQRLLEPAAE